MFKIAFVALIVAVIESVDGEAFTWAGRPTDFADSLNWNGPSPLTSPGKLGPSSVNLGSADSGEMVSLLGSNSFSMGQIVFSGPATLLIGGEGTTTFVFDSEGSAAEPEATFNPESDFKCNQNWMITENGVQRGAPTTPCGDDEIIIPSDNTYFIEIPADAGIAKITFATDGADGGLLGAGVEVTSCQSSDANTVTADGSASSVSFERGCDVSKLGSLAEPSCPASTCSTTTTVSTVTATSVTATSATATSATVTSVTTATQTSNTVTTVPVNVFSNVNDNMAASGAMGMLIGIICSVLVCVVLAAVLIFFAVRKKNEKSPDRSLQSFDNPMYEDVENIQSQQQQNNLSSGYADVVPGGVDNGYMDVPSTNDIYNDDDEEEEEEDYDDDGHNNLYDEVDDEDVADDQHSGYIDVPGANDANDFEDDEDDDDNVYDEDDDDNDDNVYEVVDDDEEDV